MSDSVAIDDVFVQKIRLALEDTIGIDDIITKRVPLALFSEVGIDDIILTKVYLQMSDDLTIDDLLSAKAKIMLSDEVGIIDAFIPKTKVKTFSEIGIDDTILTKVFLQMSDGVTIDDVIDKVIRINLLDYVGLDDILFTITRIQIIDAIQVDDLLSAKAKYRLSEDVTIDDVIIKSVHLTIFEEVLADDVIIARLIANRSTNSSMGIDDQIFAKAKYRLFDELDMDEGNPIKAVHLNSLFAIIGIDDAITPRMIANRSTNSSIGIDDQISIKAMYRLFDDVTTDDAISIKAMFSMFDEVGIDDKIFTKPVIAISDDIGIDDQISIKAMYRLFDDVTTYDAISIKAMFSMFDEVGIEDKISAKLRRLILDGITVDDTISKKSMYRLFDEVGMVDGDPIKVVHIQSVNDDLAIDDAIIRKLIARSFTNSSIGIEDTISKRVFYALSDGMKINDGISRREMKSISDQVGVSDSISLIRIFYGRNMQDFVGVGDSQIISMMYRKTMVDTITISDPILAKGILNIQTRDNNYNLIPSVSYRIIPDPSTGIGSLLVTDGGSGDYDGLPNGQISVFVPLGTYRINQTAVPAGLSSLVNFTYTTVHPHDMNATALFRVFNPIANNPQDLSDTDSDILDIADNGFDDLLSSIQLVNVANGTQVIISKTSNIPAPIFAGVNNTIAISNAIASQYTLLYKNLVLPPNDSPEDIISAFRQTPYDSGNFTQTTFVGVLAATQSASRQYLATQPFDKFNCGQQYIYGMDETIVPTYGGMTGFDLTLDAAGVCPDVQDYLTFEVAQVPSTGIPLLYGQDTLLYINPQYPRITSAGVDFSDSSNIDSFTFTLISTLPETGLINDLTVYLQAGAGWSTAGVTILSKQPIPSGQNAGKVEIILSVDHLSKMVVGGKKIPPPPPPPPIPFGFGPVMTGPSSVSGGAPDMPTARIHRVEYDVCNENIARILAAHDSSS